MSESLKMHLPSFLGSGKKEPLAGCADIQEQRHRPQEIEEKALHCECI